MGQETSKQQPPGAKAAPSGSAKHADPNAAAGADRRDGSAATTPREAASGTHESEVEAELRRMLHVRADTAGGGGAAAARPAHVQRAQELAARLGSLSAPKPPIVASSLEGFMINRHDRTVDEVVKRTPLLQQQQQQAGSALAVPHAADAHRALAALQTHDMAAAQQACGDATRVAEEARLLDFHAQLAKSTTMQATHDVHRAAVSVVAECDALCLAVHGVSCRLDVDNSASPMRPTSASNVSPAVPPRHMGLVHLAAEVAALARQIDALLTDDERADVREAAAAMPVSLSNAPSPDGKAAGAKGSKRSSAANTPPPT